MRRLTLASKQPTAAAPAARASVPPVRRHADVLQRALGNRAVQALVEAGALTGGRPMNPALLGAFAGSGPRVQRKIAIGAVDHPAEREADRIADQVMRMPDAQTKTRPAELQRKCAACEDEARGKLPAKEDRSAASAADGAALAPPIAHAVLRSPGQPLDEATRAFMEPRLGYDFGRVRVHTDAQAIESARAVNALAYTVGSDIVFAAAQYAPTVAAGRNLLAHELIHTVQQRAVPVLETDRSAASGPERAGDRVTDAGAPANGRVQVHPAGAVLARQTAPKQPGQADYASCPDDWPEKIRAAVEEARKWVNVALSRIGAILKNPAAEGAADKITQVFLTEHFKIQEGDKTNFDKVSKIYDAFQKINAAFSKPLPITCETTTPKYPKLLAYVDVDDNRIHLQSTWQSKDLPRRARNIVHETAHRFAGKGKDISYQSDTQGEYSQKLYGKLSADEAINNADCYAAFAQDIASVEILLKT